MTLSGIRTLHVPTMTASELGGIREFVKTALEDLGCGRVADALVLAVDEVCANVAEHGFAPAAPGVARITVRCAGSDAILVVEDGGRPFHPGQASAPDLDSPWQERRVGGLGWFFVQQMVDSIHYESVSSVPGITNRLTLIKRDATSASGSEGS